MMQNSKFFSLLKYNFIQMLRFDKTRYKKSSIIAIILAFLYILGITFSMVISSIIGLSPIYVKEGLSIQFINIVYIAIEIVLMIFSFFLIINSLYFSKENKILMTLPIKYSTIYFSKMVSIYIYLCAISFLLVMSSSITFGIMYNMSFFFYLFSFLSVFILPIYSICISSFIVFIVINFLSLIKNNRIVTYILSFLLIGFAMFLYYYFIKKTMMLDLSETSNISLSVESKNILNILGKIFFFNTSIIHLEFLDNFGINLLLFVAGILLFLLLIYLLSSLCFEKGVKSVNENSQNSGEIKSNYDTKSIKIALLKKDLKDIFRNNILLYYIVIEIAFPALFMLILNIDSVSMKNMGSISIILSISFLLFMGSSIDIVALSSFTREGSEFYLTKTLPIPLKVLGDTKCKTAIIFSIISAIVSSISLLIVGMVNFWQMFLVLIISSLYFVANTYFCVLFDAQNPKLIYDNIAHALQNNINSLKAMGTSMIGAMIPILSFFILLRFSLQVDLVVLISLLISLIFGIIFLIIAHMIYSKNIEKTLNNIN
jgi:ABC-2 type transport system permease protein